MFEIFIAHLQYIVLVVINTYFTHMVIIHLSLPLPLSLVLLQHGADPTITNTDGKTPLDMANGPAKEVLSGTNKYNI